MCTKVPAGTGSVLPNLFDQDEEEEDTDKLAIIVIFPLAMQNFVYLFTSRGTVFTIFPSLKQSLTRPAKLMGMDY